MIRVENAVKTFDGFRALDGLDIHVRKGSIYGLVGNNGAGKTTVIKNIMGIQKLDSGNITVDGEEVYDTKSTKTRLGFVSDEQFFFPGYSLEKMGSFTAGIYPSFSHERFNRMTEEFGLDRKAKLSSFSKGMKKQASFILAMSQMPDVLVLDEPIDGLDPVVRLTVWKYIINDVAEREMTVLVSSHNLREMEGYCDYIGIISRGKMVIERDLEDLKTDVHKVQVAFREDDTSFLDDLDIIHSEKRGSVSLLIIRESAEKIEDAILAHSPAVFDILPLSLEEIFIYEMGGVDDETANILK